MSVVAAVKRSMLQKLRDAVSSDNLNKARTLLRLREEDEKKLNDSLLDDDDDDDVPILHVAIRSECSGEMLELLLQNGASASARIDGENCLHAAVEADRCDLVQLLVSRVDIDEQTCSSLTALHVAVRRNNYKIAQLLLSNGAKVNTQSLNGSSPLHEAVYDRCVPLISLLLKHGADPNQLNEGELSPFHLSFRFDDVNVTKLFLKYGADLGLKAKYGSSALHLAAMYRSKQQLRFLLERDEDADVDEPDDFDYTALQMAIKSVVECAQCVVVDVVRLLVDRGADVNAVDQYGETALHSAIRTDSVQVVEYLASVGAELKTTRLRASTLIAAIETGRARLVECLLDRADGSDFHEEFDRGVIAFAINRVEDRAERYAIVKQLIERGAEHATDRYSDHLALDLAIAENDRDLFHLLLKSRLSSGVATSYVLQPALVTAVRKHSLEIAEILLNLGADVNGYGTEIGSVLSLAVRKSDEAMVRLLLDNGADANDDFALTDAVHFRCTDMLKVLVSHGAKIDLSTKSGYHALTYAVQDCQVDAVRYLLENGVNVNLRKSKRIPLHLALRYIDGYDSDDKLQRKVEIVYVMVKHLALLVARSRFVHSATMKLIKSRNWVCKRYEMYEQELQRMKSTEVCGKESSLTYFDVLAKSRRELARMLRCRSIVVEMELGDCRKMFPYYHDVMRCGYERGLERLKLQNRFDGLLDSVFGGRMPCIVKDKILEFMSDGDLGYCFKK